MWFGDLVTMRWWNGIWLNEAFATFMSYLCVDAMEPEWRVFDAFARIRSNAFEVDALASTRPIEYPVHSPDDASGMFDILTYTKGGAVLRMLEQWLGPERFRDGIRRYLAHPRVRRTPRRTTCGMPSRTRPASRSAGSWTPGSSSRATRRSPSRATATTSGSRSAVRCRRVPDDPTTWPVPLIVRQVTADGERLDRVLVEADGLELPLAAPDALVVANAGGASFVRVFYDDELRERLVDPGRVDLRRSSARAWSTTRGPPSSPGRAASSSFIDLDRRVRRRGRPVASGRRSSAVSRWCDRFLDGAPRERFRDFVRDLVAAGARRLGWDARERRRELDRELRGDLIRALGILGDDPETQAQAREAEARRARGRRRRPAVAAAAIDVVAFVGDADDYETFFARSRGSAPTPQEQDRYRYALARFRDPALMERTLEASLTDEVRPPGRAVPARACQREPRPRPAGVGVRRASTGTSSSSGSRRRT